MCTVYTRNFLFFYFAVVPTTCSVDKRSGLSSNAIWEKFCCRVRLRVIKSHIRILNTFMLQTQTIHMFKNDNARGYFCKL